MPTTPVFWTPEFTANDVTTGAQDEVTVTQLEDGTFWVAWTDTNGGAAGDDIFGRHFDQFGNPMGNAVQLNGFQIDNEQDSDLAADVGSSQFFIAYVDQDDADASNTNIRVSRLDADGTAAGDLTIETDPDGNGAATARDPQIAISSSTNGLVVWEASDGAGDTDIMGQRFNPSTNTLIGGAFEVSTAGIDDSIDPDITVLNNGNYVVSYSDEFNGDSTRNESEFSIVTPGGAVTTFVANTPPVGTGAAQTSITALTGGGFVLSWTEDNDIFVERYDSAGVLQGGTITVASGANNQNESEVAATNDGGFTVTWENDSAGDIRTKSYNSSGAQVGGVNFISKLSSDPIDAIGLGDGRILLGYDTGGDAFVSILDPRENANPSAVYTPNGYQIGTIGDDTITAGGAPEVIFGYDGNDVLSDGGGTATQFMGGEGDDTINMEDVNTGEDAFGDNGVDTIDFGLSNDLTGIEINLVTGMATQDTDTMLAMGFENAVGSNFADTITGDAFGNFLDGGNQDDILDGGSGSDTLAGSAGDDSINGGSGNDSVDGNVGEDTITGGSSTDTLAGNNGDDFIDGEAGSDRVLGGPGADSLFGSAGNDFMAGNAGLDVIDGGNGADDIVGGADSDQADGGSGNDTIVGNAGNDTLDGGSGADDILGQANADFIVGGSGGDLLGGNGANDTIFGGTGFDTIRGNAGNDIVDGEAGNDRLLGGNGNDTVIGGAGVDRVSGGNGADVFLFNDGETGATLASADIITDFNRAEGDSIDLSDIDAIAGGGDDSFSFIGTAAFSGTAGELRYENSGGNTNIFADTNGDSVADVALRLTDNVALVAADFVV